MQRAEGGKWRTLEPLFVLITTSLEPEPEDMKLRKCTCGAEPELRAKTITAADGSTETLYWVSCPVCGQMGPRVSDRGKDQETAMVEAEAAWNSMIAAVRPSEVFIE